MANTELSATVKVTIDIENTEAVLLAAERAGYVVIDKSELLDHYGQLREASEGRGTHREAAEAAINYLFDVLGEPGAGE